MIHNNDFYVLKSMTIFEDNFLEDGPQAGGEDESVFTLYTAITFQRVLTSMMIFEDNFLEDSYADHDVKSKHR